MATSKKKTSPLKLPDSEYDEIIVDIVGNVDSGKSSLCGILSHPLLRESLNNDTLDENLPKILDDGNGLSRSRIVTLQHEAKDGRTSSIGYNYMVFDKCEPRSKVMSLVDLAGHFAYLKTTITGIISSYPDHGLLLIAKNITHMTREHYSILATLGVPVLFVLTKMDMIPPKIVADNIRRIGIMSKNFKKELVEIKSSDDIVEVISNSKFGFIRISNKTGFNIPLLV